MRQQTMMGDRKPVWREDSLEVTLYRYTHDLMGSEERAAFEAWAAARPDILARLAAWGRARRAARYLRMRIIEGVPRPELYLSPTVEGYGVLELTPAKATHRYAAGAPQQVTRRFLQIISTDGRLLLTLRAESSATWLLTARYVTEGRWELLGEDYALVQTSQEPLPAPQCLLCLIVDLDSDAVRRRYLAWFVPDPDTPECYVARLRLPDWHSEIALARLLFGVVDADAARWLSDAERRASRDATLDPDALRCWQEWERRAPNE
jgi:hypothetical protein